MKRKYFILLLLLACISTCTEVWAQTLSKITSNDEEVATVFVRSNDNKRLFVFNNHGCSGYQFSPHMRNMTTIYITDTGLTQVKKLCDLPCGYKVYDAQFVTLRRNNAANTPVDFCVFCGTAKRDTGYMSMMQWVPRVDTFGFVGLFYIDSIFQQGPHGSVYIRELEDCRSAHRMVAYTGINGIYQPICNNIFIDNAVLDIIGVPDDTINKASLVARVKFYPECNGSIYWENSIRLPTTCPNEKVVDIIKDGDSIITASIFDNSTQEIWLRHNKQERSYVLGGINFNNKLFRFFVGDIQVTGYNPAEPKMTDFSLPVRLSNLGTDNSVLSFYAKNDYNGVVTYDGLFSFRFSLQNTPTYSIDGFYADNPNALKDVCSLPNVPATVLLTSDNKVSIAKWNTLHPLYRFYHLNDIYSVCRYKTGLNNNSIGIAMSGRKIINQLNSDMELMYHKNFSSQLLQDCFVNDVCYASYAQIEIFPYANIHFDIHKYYSHNPNKFPVTKIPIVITTINGSLDCAQWSIGVKTQYNEKQ